MLFASFDFLLFLPVALAGYWALSGRPRLRLLFLLVASYFFYAASPRPASGSLPAPWVFPSLLLLSTLVNYAVGLCIAASKRRFGTGRGWLTLAILGNLGLLGYFKYTGFLLECATEVATHFGLEGIPAPIRTALPIGISFYTFQCISYVVDVYRESVEAERSFGRFALYIAFFPQLIAGPIVRASEFLPALRQRLRVESRDVDEALFRITRGLVKKLLFADLIAAGFTDIVLGSPSSYSSLEVLLALYAFTLQIYADFSGYTDIAIGVARLFGFSLPENFDRPYQATSVGDFWRRWHMTLSAWLKDYVFVPLGGSRVGPLHVYFNLWLTMFLVGMWHGASWTFVAYSMLQAFAMAFDRFVRLRPDGFARRAGRAALFGVAMAMAMWIAGHLLGLSDIAPIAALAVLVYVCVFGLLPRAEEAPWLTPLHIAATFHFVVLSRIFFRADTLETARELCRKLLSPDGGGVRPEMFRAQAFHDAIAGSDFLPSAIQSAALAVSDQAILLLLVLGLSVHFVPARRLEQIALAGFVRLPAWGVAGLVGVLCAALPFFFSAPRPNIYFAF